MKHLERRARGWSRGLAPAAVCLAVVVTIIASGAAAVEAGQVQAVTVDTHGQATRVQISVAGDVNYNDFTLRNPDRLVLDFRGATTSLPATLPAEWMTGIIRAGQVLQWDRDGEEPSTRIVFELANRASYSISRNGDEVVVVLDRGAPSAGDLGYDEDHLASDGAGDHGSRTAAPETAQTTDRYGMEAKSVGGPIIVDTRTDTNGRTFSPHVYGSGGRLEDPPGIHRSRARRVSLDVQKANIMTVVRTLGQLSGRNIVTNAEVDGDVTLRLNDVPWPHALDIVLLTQGLGFTDEEGVIRIASLEALREEEVDREEAARKREELLPVQTEVIEVNFAKAHELQPSVAKMLSTRGIAQVDERTNTVIVTDIAQKVTAAKALVARLDTRTPQVEIDARMVDVDVSDSVDLGIDWQFTVTEQGAGDLNRPQSFHSINPIANPAGELRVGAIRPNWTVDAVIQALVNDRSANIISNPRITTVNNREASILVGQEIPLIVQDEAFNSVIQLKQIGIKLSVRPHINSDGMIEMDVHPEVSDLASQATVQGGIIINTSEADTRVLVGNGDTAVIGGLIRENELELERGIPLLKDIPALGWLFKSTSTVEQKRELLIFITPRIVDEAASSN